MTRSATIPLILLLSCVPLRATDAPAKEGNAPPTSSADSTLRPRVLDRSERPLGPLAYNAKWARFGPYLQKLVDAVDARWATELKAVPGQAPTKADVTVTFVMNERGIITSTRATTTGVTNPWLQTCLRAISPSPEFSYGPWTPEMIGVLGQSQEITFFFYFR